tara:strand:+ start:438 stop:857 length:420 start_codon:yes stop_codon:yes gene_type:complete
VALLPVDDLLDQAVLQDALLTRESLLRHAALRFELRVDHAHPVLAELLRPRGAVRLDLGQALLLGDQPLVRARLGLLHLTLQRRRRLRRRGCTTAACRHVRDRLVASCELPKRRLVTASRSSTLSAPIVCSALRAVVLL